MTDDKDRAGLGRMAEWHELPGDEYEIGGCRAMALVVVAAALIVALTALFLVVL